MALAKKIGVSVVVLALAVGGGGYYWHSHQAAPPAGAQGGFGGAGGMPPMPVVTQKTMPQTLTITIRAVGTLLAGESAEIHSEIAGPVKDIFFEEGQPVKEGDVLLEIDGSLIATELASAQASYDVNKLTLSRQDELKKSGYVTTQKWDETKAQMQEAKASSDQARIRLGKTKIHAPFDGLVGLRNFSKGAYVQVGQALTTVDSINPVKIEFSVPEREYAALQTGQKIKVSLDAWPNEVFEGAVYAIDSKIDPETRNFKVKANIPNPDGRLRSGMYARIEIATATKENALMVAEEALIPKGDDSFVFVVKDGVASMKKITTGIRQDGMVEAVSGLEAGDEIVTAGAMRIHDGAKVMTGPPPSAPPAAPAAPVAPGATK